MPTEPKPPEGYIKACIQFAEDHHALVPPGVTKARAEHATLLKDKIDAEKWREHGMDLLVGCYRIWPAKVAKACDEEIDRTGALLKKVRDAVQKDAKNDHD